MVRAGLELPGVAVDARYKRVDMLPLVIEDIELPDTGQGAVIGIVVKMDPPGLDVYAKELQPVLIWLVVELALVESYADGGKTPAKLRHEGERVLVLELRHHHHAVVHEESRADAALIIEPVHDGIEV